jgi:hypothetical protein
MLELEGSRVMVGLEEPEVMLELVKSEETVGLMRPDVRVELLVKSSALEAP